MSMVPCVIVPEIVMGCLVWWVIYYKIILNGCDLCAVVGCSDTKQ
jgi:hypothetical protein